MRRGRDWFAVRTGVDSNDMNGVVSQARAEISAELVDDLVAWFRADAVSASWLTTIPDPQLTRTLLAAGARAERTGYWSGCSMPTPARPRAAGVEVVRVVSDHHLETLTHWLALDHDQPVGFASSFLDANVIDLCNLGVAESHRRRGIWPGLGYGPARRCSPTRRYESRFRAESRRLAPPADAWIPPRTGCPRHLVLPANLRSAHCG